MKNQFTKSLILLFITSFCINLISQDIPELKNSEDFNASNFMNEFKSNGYNQNPYSEDGSFMVTGSDLNATYSIPLSNETINGSSVNFSLDYNGGIEHKAIQGISSYGSSVYQTFSRKIPTWFLSVNGFVVQAFVENRTILQDVDLYSKDRYKNSHLSTISNPVPPNNTEQKYIFSNKDFNFSIKGYHYNNSIEPFGSQNGSYLNNTNNHDKIHILKSNGGLLTLINTESRSGFNRTGIYSEFGINSKGFAIVDNIEDPQTCDLIRDYGNIKRRKVRYFPGDGNEYVFIEYLTPYGTDITKANGLDYVKPNIGNMKLENGFNLASSLYEYNPTIFYLSEIYNDNQNIATFYYDRHHPYTNAICSDKSFGRARLINFNDNWIEYGPGVVNIRTQNRNIRINLEKTGLKNKMDFLTAYGGRIEYWQDNVNGISLFEPSNLSNLSNYINNIHKLSEISLDIANQNSIPSEIYEHSTDVLNPRSDNHSYILQYVDNVEITEIRDKVSVEEEDKFVTKKISFKYEKNIKSINNIDYKSSTRLHPALPFLGLIGASANQALINATLADDGLVVCEGTSPLLNIKDAISSKIQFRDLRLSEIIEPSKSIEINYFTESLDALSNTIDADNLNFSNTSNESRSFFFNNNCVEEIKYYNIPSTGIGIQKNLYLSEKNDIVFSTAGNSIIEYNCDKSASTISGNERKIIANDKIVNIYEPKSGNIITKIESYEESREFSVAVFESNELTYDQSFNNYKTYLPVKSEYTYSSPSNYFDPYKVISETGYAGVCDNSIGSNLIKPFYSHTWIEKNGTKLSNSLSFFDYELNNSTDDLKEFIYFGNTNVNTSFGREIIKKITYNCPAPAVNTTIDYSSYFSNITNNYLTKEVVEFSNFKLDSNMNISVNKQFNSNESAILEKYYKNSFIKESDDFSSKRRGYSAGSGSFARPSNYGKEMNSYDKGHNSTQTTYYEVSSDQFSLEYSLCYLLTDLRNFDDKFTREYGNSYIVAKPKFGITNSQELYGNINQTEIFLKRMEYDIQDKAYIAPSLTYSRGKPKNEEVFESELYGGNRTNYITSKRIEYAVGAQGGGLPSKVYLPNGAHSQNYYVYNHKLHLNNNGSNPVYSVQDFWPHDLVDDENFPCNNADYFIPAGKIVSADYKYSGFESNVYNDKLIESNNVFYRNSPVATRNFVRKFKPFNGGIELFDKFPNSINASLNKPFIVTTNSPLPSNLSGSFYFPVDKEILSLNKAYEYNNFGQPTAVVDVNGFATRFKYDGFGRIKKVNRPYDYIGEQDKTLEKTDYIVIDGLTMSEEKEFEAHYEIKKVDTVNPKICEHNFDGLTYLAPPPPSKTYFDLFEAGGDAFDYQKIYNSCDGFDDKDTYTEKVSLSNAIITFRIPYKVEVINSIVGAYIVLNIAETPELEEQESLILYLQIEQLNEIDDKNNVIGKLEKKLEVYLDNHTELVSLDDNNQLYRKIIFDLADYIDLNDLKALFNQEPAIDGHNLKFTPLKLVISPYSLDDKVGDQDPGRFRGKVKFHMNTTDRSLSPKLGLKGEFTSIKYRDRDYYTNKEFTLFNNYGNFGGYVNSYSKIDNKPFVPINKFAEPRFINNFSFLGFNYQPVMSRVFDYVAASGTDYLLHPQVSANKATNVYYNDYDFNGKVIKSSEHVYDGSEKFIDDFDTKTRYDGSGNLIQTTLDDGTTVDVEYAYSDGSEFLTNYPNIKFSGFAKKILTIKKSLFGGGIRDLDIFDLRGNLVLSFKDINMQVTNLTPSPGQYTKLVKYNYDIAGNLKNVSEFVKNDQLIPKFRDIYYWYDHYGRVNHSYHPDFGYTHFSYDNSGNLRFKQDQKQYDEDRISYYEYDDLNRLLITGDAKLDTLLFPTVFNKFIDDNNGIENSIFNTMLDQRDGSGVLIVNPNVLNDHLVSLDDNSNRILTSNKTMWIDDNNYDCYLYDGIINDTLYSIISVPLILDKANSILGTNYDLPPAGIVHKNYLFYDSEYPNNTNNGASPDKFEHLNWYDNFIRRVNFYDELPPQIGKLWKYMPHKDYINYLSYDKSIENDVPATLYNIKGRVAVQAYRDYENQPFNFIYYSYDARGRIESLIRFTENIGFDCIYYKYNSMDKIVSMVAMGPNTSIKTAYKYDDFSRLSKVYSQVSSGHGLLDLSKDYSVDNSSLGSLNINFLGNTGANPDIEYVYDSDGKVTNTKYSPITTNINISYKYEPGLRMLEEIIAYDKTNTPLFSEKLGYDIYKRIYETTTEHAVNGLVEHQEYLRFNHDNVNQLAGVAKSGNVELQTYNYDGLGNRIISTDFEQVPPLPVIYNYGLDYPNSSRLIKAEQPNKWFNTYSYYSTGQLKDRSKSERVQEAIPGVQDPLWYHTKEKFEYNSFGLLREYKSDYYYGSYDCDKPLEVEDEVIWRYGYNPFNERESKRMVKSPDGDKRGNTYPMMYYLLDEKNRQHINYLGMQSSNPTLLSFVNNNTNYPVSVPNKFPNYYWPTCIWNYPPDPPPTKSEQVLIYPAQMNVFGGGMSPQISYKYDRATSSWKKHYNIYDHLGTLVQTYKQVGLGATPTSMQTHNPFGGERWTNSNLTTKESTLLNWVGKEKDKESKLGDHGVRKYEYETGRFISIDPLWSKYYGWTPYQYSMNSPVMLVDVGGNELEVASELQDNLFYAVAPEYRAYIKYDKNGIVNKDLIGSVNPTRMTDPIFRAVQIASLRDEKAIIENNEKFYGIFKGKMTETSLDGKGVEHLNKYAGYTVFPKSKDSGFYTDDGNTHIYIDPTFPEFSQSQSLIREVRDHFLNSLLGLPYQHNTESKSDINLYDEHKRTGDEVTNNSTFNPVPYRK